MKRRNATGYYIFYAVPGDFSNGVIRVSRDGYHIIKETWEGSRIINAAAVFYSSDEDTAKQRLTELQAGARHSG